MIYSIDGEIDNRYSPTAIARIDHGDYSKSPPFVQMQNQSIDIIHFFDRTKEESVFSIDRSKKGRIGILYRSIHRAKEESVFSID